MGVDLLYDYYIAHGVFTEDELQLVCDMNGYSKETLNDCLYARYGYRDLYQWQEENL